MPVPKTVLCIMDMATVGRASLAVAMPALAACGVQCCPLPASLFSSHTGGFSGVRTLDTAGFAEEALAQYREEGIVFDAVYIGYLRGAGQLALARAALETFPAAYKVVDPALGDGGRAYSGIDDATIRGMAELCAMADLITPNITECALLAGEVPAAADAANDRDELETALRLQAGSLIRENASFLITSVPAPKFKIGNTPSVAIAVREGAKKAYTLATHRLPQDYPGTGDLFTASVLGLLLAGHFLYDAVQRAAYFVGTTVRTTLEGGGEPRMGLWLEPCLPLLTAAMREPQTRATP